MPHVAKTEGNNFAKWSWSCSCGAGSRGFLTKARAETIAKNHVRTVGIDSQKDYFEASRLTTWTREAGV